MVGLIWEPENSQAYSSLESFFCWAIGTVIVLLILVCAVILFITLVRGIFTAFDSWFQPRYLANALVVEKKFSRAYSEYMPSGHDVDILISHPNRYSLIVKVGDHTSSSDVSEELFNLVEYGQQFLAEVVVGRFSGKLYIKKVFLI